MAGNMEAVNDARTMAVETRMGDDVAGVRSGIRQQHDNWTDDNDKDDERAAGSSVLEDDTLAGMQYSYMVDEQQQLNSLTAQQQQVHRANEVAQYIETIADSFNVDVTEPLKRWKEDPKRKRMWDSKREKDPLSEFDNLGELLVGAFPHIFIFGTAYPSCTQSSVTEGKKKDRIYPSQVRHLLLQYTTAAARCRELQSYLFDYKIRHTFMTRLSMKIKSDPASFQKYSEQISSAEFKKKIVAAAEDPTSKTAKEVLAAVLPFLSFTTADSPLGALGGRDAITKGIAMVTRYGGSAVTLVTISPDDVNNPTSFRASFRSVNNEGFPAVATEEFLKKFRDGKALNLNPGGTAFGGESTQQQGTIPIPMAYKDKVKAANDNPVAVAQEFQKLLENVISELFGCKLDVEEHNSSKNVRTWYFKSKAENSPRHCGIFGNLGGVFGSIEIQVRLRRNCYRLDFRSSVHSRRAFVLGL
jgi:hypothetical protein